MSAENLGKVAVDTVTGFGGVITAYIQYYKDSSSYEISCGIDGGDDYIAHTFPLTRIKVTSCDTAVVEAIKTT